MVNQNLISALLKIVSVVELSLISGFKLVEQEKDKWWLLDADGRQAIDEDEPWIIMGKYEDGTYYPMTITLPKALKRKGIATSAYLALAKHYGKIRSDHSLSDDAADFWESLVDRHGAKVFSWDIEDLKLSDVQRKFGEDAVLPGAKYDPKTFWYVFELYGK